MMIRMGKMGKPHGTRGAIRLWPDNPETDLLKPGYVLKLVSSYPSQEHEVPRELVVRSVKSDGKGLQVSFASLNSRNDVEPLVHWIWIESRNAFPALDDKEYYVRDVVGFDVFTEEGVCIGTVQRIWPRSAQSVFVIDLNDSDTPVYVPDVPEFIVDVSTENKRVTLSPIPGLLDL